MSNPMPPPEFKPSSEKKEDKAGGMSQDDFRKMLATPRAVPGGPSGIRGTFSGGGIRALGSANRTSRAPVPQTPRSSDGSGFHKPKPKKPANKNPAKEASTGSKYRDRATERRQGINPDYVETEQILNTLEEAAADVAPEVLYEQSKFLGGDREHTHLVKGLDFALLNKVRQEDTENDPEAAATMDLDTVFEDVEKAVKEETASGKFEIVKPEMSSALAANIYKYAIEDSAKKPPQINEMFIPGRTVFVFEVPITSKTKRPKSGAIEDYNPFVVPTTVVRSRADVDQNQAGAIENPENDMVMRKIMNVLQSIRTGDRKAADSEAEAKDKKKAAAAAAAKLAASKLQDEEVLPMVEPDLEGDDIFADVGRDYVVEPTHQQDHPTGDVSMDVDVNDSRPMVGPERPEDVDMSQYFGEQSDDDDEEQDEEKAPQDNLDADAPILGPSRPSEVDMANYFGEASDSDESDQNDSEDRAPVMPHDDTRIVQNEGTSSSSGGSLAGSTDNVEKAPQRRKARLEDLEVDEDADYYSAYGLGMSGRSLGNTAYDSDEDEDEGHSTILMDQGTHKNKRAQLGRFDFDTEEGFNRYKDTVEAVPKTAFQFGVKMGDGRKTGKWEDGKNKGLSKDEKLDRDWQRISRLMEKNSGSGGQKSKARQDEGGAGSSNHGGDNRSKRRKNNNW